MPHAARLLMITAAVLVSGQGLVYSQDGEGPAPAAQPDENGDLNRWDRLIYVPFRELQKVFDNQNASAVIPYSEYMQLLKAYLNRTEAADAPPQAVITRSEYSGTVEKDIVRVDAVLSITVLKQDGWARLPLSFGKASVGKLTTDDDSKVILKGATQGAYELLLNGPGEYSVTLELLSTIKTSSESRSFGLNCPTAGISELTLTIPEADQAVKIAPLQVLLPVDGSNDEQTVVKASLGATNRFDVSWNPRAGSQPVMDLLASVTNVTNVRVEPGLIQSTAALEYEVLRGELTEVTVLVPPDARVIDVVSSNGRIGNWSPEAVGDTHQKLQVNLLTPVTDRFQLTVQIERTPAADSFQLVGMADGNRVEGIHADGIVRESGRLKLTSDSSLTTLVQSQTGVKRIDAADGNSKGSSGGGQAWEFSGKTGVLIIRTKPVEPRLLVDQASRIVFDDDELRLNSQLTYTVERAGVFELKLRYPDSLTIDTVEADGMSEFNTDKEAGSLTLSLTQKRLGKINVTISAHQSFDAAAENAESVLPTVTPLGAERENGQIVVYAPQFLDVITVEDGTTGAFPGPAAQSASIGRAVQVASWKYTQQSSTPEQESQSHEEKGLKLTVRTSPRPAQVTGSVATTATIEPKRVDVSSVLRFEIRNAGIDTFRVAVPEGLADKIGFTSRHPQHRIQQSNRSADAVEGWVTWTLVLRDEVTGTVELNADWITSLEELADETAEQKITLEPVRILPPFTEEQADKRRVTLSEPRGEIRLLRHESLSIDAESGAESVEKIDVRELQLLPQEGYQAFRYFSQPASAIVSIRKHEIHDVVATVVSRAAVEVVTDKQALANYRCRFRITTSERQRLRIDLPSAADLQAPLIDERRTTFEAADETSGNGWDAYYVNISRETPSDESFVLTLQYRCPITEADRFPYENQGGKQIIRLPLVGDGGGATVVQETRVAVWGPEDIAFVGEPTHWSIAGRQMWSIWNPMVSPGSAAEANQLHDWVGSSSSSADFARQGNVTVYRALGRQPQVNIVWWNRPFLVAVISGALLFVGFILRRTSWENRLTLTIAGFLAVALWALKDSSEALQFVSAGSLALIAVAGIWLTGLLTGSERAGQKKDESVVMLEAADSRPDSQQSESDGGESDGGESTPAAATTEQPKVEKSEGGHDSPDAPTPPVAGDSGNDETRSDAIPPGTVSPSPDVAKWMNDLMGGKS